MDRLDKPLAELTEDIDDADKGFTPPPIPSLTASGTPFTARHTGGPVQLPISPNAAVPAHPAPATPTDSAPSEPPNPQYSLPPERADAATASPREEWPVMPPKRQASLPAEDASRAEPPKETAAEPALEPTPIKPMESPASAPTPSPAPAANGHAATPDEAVKLTLTPPSSPDAAPTPAPPKLATSTPRSAGELTLDSLIQFGAAQGASDLFLKADAAPALKLHGRIVPTDFPVLSEEDAKRLAYEHMSAEQQAQFEHDNEMNLSFTVPNVARIRQNVYWQRNTIATTCRMIPLRVKSLGDLQIDSKAIIKFTEEHNGLVLVTGPTGSGKTTTLAAMIDHMNEHRHLNIITIEDPIEYVHTDKKAIISQREVGIDTVSFNEALKQVLRQTPDVILVGELRDLDTMNVALQASETGHLVFATLHTSSAAETLDRISNMYQPHERAMLWLRLSVSLRGVVSQKLLRRADGSGRIGAMEIMVATPSISKQLEEGRSEDMYATMRQDGDEKYWGMQTMNQCLDRYYAQGIITEEEALLNAGNVAELKQMLRRTAADPAFKKAA